MKGGAETSVDDIVERLRERGLLEGARVRCAKLHVTIEEAAGWVRSKSAVRARHVLWRWLHDERGLSWPEVAALFGRSHDSIIHASGKLETKARTKSEDRVAEKIATWLVDEGVADARSFVNPVARSNLAVRIRAGDWR